MKELILSGLEKEFILKSISERTRLDGREANAYRNIRVWFGEDRGCCFVDMGATKVMVQVSCEVTVPKETRPNEGSIMVNVELSPMAAPHFEAGRPSDESIEVNRLLERCLRDSRCVDTESLCIVSGRKAWEIRVDVHVLNYDGNIVDASSIAAIAALCHFRRPDVSVRGDDITIHTLEDRDPIPLSIYHMPICTTFAFFDVGKFMVIDPTQHEEAVANGAMVIAMNKHREICLLRMTGDMLLLQEQVLRCSSIAAMKVGVLTELIQNALQNDTEARKVGKQGSFSLSADVEEVTSVVNKLSEPLDVKGVEQAVKLTLLQSESVADGVALKDNIGAKILDRGVATIGEGGDDTWQQCKLDVDLQSLAQSADDAAIVVDDDSAVSDSEEEDVMILNK